jgi:hypothetical protein
VLASKVSDECCQANDAKYLLDHVMHSDRLVGLWVEVLVTESWHDEELNEVTEPEIAWVIETDFVGTLADVEEVSLVSQLFLFKLVSLCFNSL